MKEENITNNVVLDHTNDPETIKELQKEYQSNRYQSPYTKNIPEDIIRNFDGSPTQRTVLEHICDQTLGYRKFWDRITVSQFIEHTRLSRPTIIRAIHWLNKKWIYALYQCRHCKQYLDKVYNPCPLCNTPASFCAFYSPILNKDLIKRYKKLFKKTSADEFLVKNNISVKFFNRFGKIISIESVKIFNRTTKEEQQKIITNVHKRKSEISDYTDLTELSEKSAYVERVMAFWDGQRAIYGWRALKDQTTTERNKQRKRVEGWFSKYPVEFVQTVISDTTEYFVNTHIGDTISSINFFETALQKAKDKIQPKKKYVIPDGMRLIT